MTSLPIRNSGAVAGSKSHRQANVDVARYYHAVDGRVDLRIPEIDLRAMQQGLLLGDVGEVKIELRLILIQCLLLSALRVSRKRSLVDQLLVIGIDHCRWRLRPGPWPVGAIAECKEAVS